MLAPMGEIKKPFDNIEWLLEVQSKSIT